jgi:hypothetical protein
MWQMQYIDDRSEYNGLTPVDVSPFVRVDGWLAKLRQRAQATTQADQLPSFFLISGRCVLPGGKSC